MLVNNISDPILISKYGVRSCWLTILVTLLLLVNIVLDHVD